MEVIIMYEIYKIENQLSGRVYIGTTSRGSELRISEHLAGRGGAKLLTNDISKLGRHNFKASRLLMNIKSREEAAWYECLMVSRYRSHTTQGGYNVTRGGEFLPGFKHDKEFGRVISEALKGVPKSIAHRKNLSAARLGKYTQTENGFFNKHHTDETKAILSETNSKKIAMLNSEGETLEVFSSLASAAKYLNDRGITSNSSCNSRISKVCLGKPDALSAYGFKWKYVE